MDFVIVGKLVNTHALKGEVRIISDFDFKDRVFVKNNKLYLGKDREEVIIDSYRRHKNYEMCLFKGYSYNDVLKFKGSLVYIDRSSLGLGIKEYLDEDLIGLSAFNEDKKIGVVQDVINNNGYKLFLVSGKYIPYNKEFIVSIDLNGKQIFFKNLEGIL